MAREYFAFISYQRQDEEWAKWLAHELEHYHLPISLNGRRDLPKELRPIFRDIDELSAGNLPKQIHTALENSKNLIVICSPNSAKSKWVNKEIEEFIHLGRINSIFPFVIGGVPMSANRDEECFPSALKNLPKEEERLGGNINEKGRDAAVVKVVSGMLNLDFDSLWQRYEREKAEEERRIREQRDNLLRIQSRFLSEKANSLVEEGDSFTARLLALEALPKVSDNPDRPYVVEAEIALRNAFKNNNKILRGHVGRISSISFSPDGRMLASASMDNYIRLWDAQTGEFLFKLEKPSTRKGKFRHDIFDGLIDELNSFGFNSIAFSPDGTLLVSAGQDSSIYVWNLERKECVTTIYNYDIHHKIYHALFSVDGQKIISAGDYSNDAEEYIPGFSLWDCKTGKHLCDKDTNGSIYDISLSPDGNKIAIIGSNRIQLLDSESLKLLLCFVFQSESDPFYYPRRITFSPSGELLVSSSDDTIRIWEISTGKQVRIIRVQGIIINTITFSSDGKSIISGGRDSIVYMWNVQTGECIFTLKGHTNDINTLAASSLDNVIASSGSDFSIRLWDPACSFSKNLIKSCVFTDSSEINRYNIGDDYQIEISRENLTIFDSPSGTLVKTYQRVKNNSDYCKAYSEDMTKEVYYDIDDNSIVINDNKNQLCYSLKNPHIDEVNYMAFSPDGNSFLSIAYDNIICVISSLPQSEEAIATREKVVTRLKGHIDIVRWAAYSPDGMHIVSASDDMTIRVWDYHSGKCLQIYHTNNPIDFVNFTPDCRYIISIGRNAVNKTIQIWTFNTLQVLIDETRQCLGNRKLTPEERHNYYLD